MRTGGQVNLWKFTGHILHREDLAAAKLQEVRTGNVFRDCGMNRGGKKCLPVWPSQYAWQITTTPPSTPNPLLSLSLPSSLVCISFYHRHPWVKATKDNGRRLSDRWSIIYSRTLKGHCHSWERAKILSRTLGLQSKLRYMLMQPYFMKFIGI